jgi:hypothetical protein
LKTIHKDVSQIGSALCDSVVVDDEGNPRVQEDVIKKGQMFETLDAVKLFFSGVRCTSPSTILCGLIKQKRTVHHKVSDFEL